MTLIVHAISRPYQVSVHQQSKEEANKLRYTRKATSKSSPTPNTLRSARATAANVPRKPTHRSLSNKRTELSQSADQSKSSRTSTCKSAERLLSNLTEEPRKIPSARETMLRVVLETTLVVPMFRLAHQSSAPHPHPSLLRSVDIEYLSWRHNLQ